ncbi:unnamed protein product [Psylliodes chrysocephalus]|uniref:Uncharacterized protein n=1 Tax=Psylliodes chrysocephalus TaxID=3402493 RepID=A0A9P0GF69_9CUCU|nr:unnamed protein product [Psylliodes chrysocephala]
MWSSNTKKKVEVSREWAEAISDERQKPTPFIVVSMDQSHVRNLAAFFEILSYKKKCEILNSEARLTRQHPRLIEHKLFYNRSWISSVVTTPRNIRCSGGSLEENEFLFPHRAYEDN